MYGSGFLRRRLRMRNDRITIGLFLATFSLSILAGARSCEGG